MPRTIAATAGTELRAGWWDLHTRKGILTRGRATFALGYVRHTVAQPPPVLYDTPYGICP